MQFNFVLDNHSKNPDIAARFSQIIYPIRVTLSRLGHGVSISHDQIFLDQINLFLEYFTDREYLYLLKDLKVSKNLTYGVINTELYFNKTIPYMNKDVLFNKPNNFIDRVEGLEEACKNADFVWSLFENTAKECLTFNSNSKFFPFGFLGLVNENDHRAEKNIDVAFFGKVTPHRLNILQKLNKIGLSVYVVGAGWEKGYLPDILLQSVLDRTKIGLHLTQFAWDRTDESDPRFVSCARIVEMLENRLCVVSDFVPNNPYSRFIHEVEDERIPSYCQELILSGSWKKEAEDNFLSFQNNMSMVKMCKPIIDETLSSIY